MKLKRMLFGLAVLAGGIVATGLAAQQRRAPERLPYPEPRFTPKFEAVAETSLLMEGLAQPNYRAVEKHLDGKGPPDAETWKFARGQALLIAETGNLLLLRPPRNTGRDTWMRRAMDMRQSAGNLAQRLGNRDLERSRAALADLTIKCNSCHQTFRVPTRIEPNAE
ncbi:MAG TPA: cytochrome c [Gemmataceae bacterium]|jgi:hypothetical protein